MSEPLTPKFTPFLAADVVDVDGRPGWARRIKEASNLEGHALRVGADFSIEAKSVNLGNWQSVLLPHGGTAFASAEEAGLALRMITGEDPIPNVLTHPTGAK